MGLSSIILVKPDDLPLLIKNFMKKIIDKVIEISKRNMENKVNKRNFDEPEKIVS